MEPFFQPLEALVHRVTGRGEPLRVVEMPGGASTRRFFRVDLGGGRTAVAMYVPDASKPDEIAKIAEGGRRWPFLEVQALLADRGVSVPALLGEATEHGVVLVEDLGDETLAAYLAHAPERKEAVYRTAVRDLARAQGVLGELPAESIVRQRAFDFDLLRWELDHFREWGLEGRGITPSATQRARLDTLFDSLANTIASWPRGFVHRDYQSRNLMIRGTAPDERIVWIDFQDALLGPRVYDLVALLNDSYQTFDDAFVSARLDDYAAVLRLTEVGRARLEEEFLRVTVQRKLKDAGRFVFIEKKKGDPSYLPFVEPTLEKVRRALKRLEHDAVMADLAELLDALTPRPR